MKLKHKGRWGWGINGLNVWVIYDLHGYGIYGLNGWGIYDLNGWGIYGLNGWDIYDLNGWGIMVGHLWLKWGSYCFREVCSKNAGLQGSTLSGPHMT